MNRFIHHISNGSRLIKQLFKVFFHFGISKHFQERLIFYVKLSENGGIWFLNWPKVAKIPTLRVPSNIQRKTRLKTLYPTPVSDDFLSIFFLENRFSGFFEFSGNEKLKSPPSRSSVGWKLRDWKVFGGTEKETTKILYQIKYAPTIYVFRTSTIDKNMFRT